MLTTTERRCRWSRALKIAMPTIASVLMMFTPSSASASLTVASDTWADDQPDGDGNFHVYGRGTADTDTGWVWVSAWLRMPSGGGLDQNTGSGSSSAQADVSYVLNAFSMESGDYSTLSQGTDVDQAQGCQTSFFGISPYTDLTERTGSTCFGGAYNVYHSQCSHACAFPQDYCAVFGFTGQYVHAVGLRFRTYFSWCGPRVWRDGYVPCIEPTF